MWAGLKAMRRCDKCNVRWMCAAQREWYEPCPIEEGEKIMPRIETKLSIAKRLKQHGLDINYHNCVLRWEGNADGTLSIVDKDSRFIYSVPLDAVIQSIKGSTLAQKEIIGNVEIESLKTQLSDCQKSGRFEISNLAKENEALINFIKELDPLNTLYSTDGNHQYSCDICYQRGWTKDGKDAFKHSIHCKWYRVVNGLDVKW
jgi:hypothetical protein